MKHKRLMALLLALAMMITFMPAMAFAGDEPEITENSDEATATDVIEDKISMKNEQLPKLTNLHWNADNGFQYMARWDDVEDARLYNYTVTLYWKGSGSSEQASVEKSTNYRDSAYDFSDFFENHKEGSYWFEVTALDNQGTPISQKTESEKTLFRKLTVICKTVGTDGETEISEDGGDSFLSYKNGGKKNIEPMYWPSDTGLVLEGDPNRWFFVKSITFDNNPSDLKYDNGKAYFSIGDKNRLATVTFQKDETIVPVIVDFCEGHKELAEEVCAKLQEKGYTSSVTGTKISLNWPLADIVDGPEDVVHDVLYELNSDILINNGEIYYGTLGSKELSGYANYSEYEKDISDYPKQRITKKTVIYVHWAKPAKSGSFTLKRPICGSEVTVTEGNAPQDDILPIDSPGVSTQLPVQSPVPVITADKTSQLVIFETEFDPKHWFITKDISTFDFTKDSSWFKGIVKGGNNYIAGFIVESRIGYYFDPDSLPEITVNGEKVELTLVGRGGMDSNGIVVADIKAEHDWGAWVVTRKPTTKREGEETRTCKHCGATETRPIPKLDEDGSNSKSPKTADESYPVLWITVMLMAVAMLACTATVRIRQRNRRS